MSNGGRLQPFPAARGSCAGKGEPPRVVGTDAARSTDWQNTLIAGIDAGERFILSLTRPAP